MRPEFYAFYGGPDQIMVVTSGIATVIGVALTFWNKLLVTFGKIANRFRPVKNSDEVSSTVPKEQ